MSCTRTPSRAAACRSMLILTCNPPWSRSVVTSTTPGTCFTRSRTPDTRFCNSSMSELHNVNWYCESDCRPPTRTSCAGNMNTRRPGISASFGRMRAMTRWVLSPPRSLSGFRVINRRPKLTAALKFEAPTDEPRPATAGSASTTSIALSCRAFMASNEMSGDAIVPPKTRPVSSCGK